MRILFINSVYKYGSTGRLVHDLKESMKGLGHEVLVAYGRHKQETDEDAFYFGSNLSSMGHLLATRLMGNHGLHSTRKTKRLIKVIKEFKPDVIHLHNLHGYYLNVPLLFDFLKKIDVPVVWTLHDCWSVSGSAAYFDFDGCKVWDEGCVECNNTKTYPEVWLFPNQKKNFAWKREVFTSLDNLTIITVSDWLKELMETTFLNKYEIKRIYNGIDLETFVPKMEELNNDKIKLLGVANKWEERKGLNDFIALSKTLAPNYEITLIGLSKDQISELPSNIIGIQRTDSIQDLVQYYQKSNLYLNLSVEETMGLTTVEALACGTPAIVYDKTAVPEVINAYSGIVVEANDIASLKAVIEAFDFEAYTIDNCRERALGFAQYVMIENYINVYKSC